MFEQLLSDQILFFCEQAGTGADGKLNVQGVFNELYSTAFPATQDHIVLAGILEWQRSVDREVPFIVEIRDTHGKKMFTIEGATRVDPRSPERAPAKTHLIFPLENLVFMQAGDYRVDITVDKTVIKGPTLYVLNSGNRE